MCQFFEKRGYPVSLWSKRATIAPNNLIDKTIDSHSYLLYSSPHPSHVKNSIPYSQFLDFDVYVMMFPTLPANQRRCASFSKNVAILTLWSKLAIIAPNYLIDSQHYKRRKKIRMTEFHSSSLSILIITQSKASFLIILNYSKMIPRLVESFRNLHIFHSIATKTYATF